MAHCLSIWMPGVAPEGQLIRFQYEVRTLVYESYTSSAGAIYHAVHWHWQKRDTAAHCSADGAHQLILAVFRFAGQLGGSTPLRAE